MTRLNYKLLMDDLKRAGVERISPHKMVNVDEANVFTIHGKVYVMGPRSKVLRHACAHEADCSMHISIVAAARANGLPYDKPIIIMAAKNIPPAFGGLRDEYFSFHRRVAARR